MNPNIGKAVILHWKLIMKTIHRSLLSTIIATHFRTKSIISAATSITNHTVKKSRMLPKTLFQTLWATVLPTATWSASILLTRNSWSITSSTTLNKTISSKTMSIHLSTSPKILTIRKNKESPCQTLKKSNLIAAISSMNNLSLQKILSLRETRCKIWPLTSQATTLKTSSQFIMNLQLNHMVIKDSNHNIKEKTFSRTSSSLHIIPVEQKTPILQLILKKNQTLKKMKF